MKKKVLRTVLATVVVLSLGLVSAGSVLADGPGAETGNWACTEVVKCPAGYGQAVFHINGHCTLLPDGDCKFDLHMQGKVTVKPPDGKNMTEHFQKKLVCNGQAGEDGVFNGQCMFSVNGADVEGMKFHCICHYANGEAWCKVVPVVPG